MYRRWQELSRTAETTAKILNLIWTDLSSNAVVGTRGLHGAGTQSSSSLEKRNDAISQPESNTPGVKYMQRRVRYRLTYAVPAFVVLFLTAVIAFISLVLTLMGRAGASQMRRYLNKTSQGRILTTYLYSPKGEIAAQARPAPHLGPRGSTKRWVKNMGKNPVSVTEGRNDFLVVDGLRSVQAQPLLQERSVK